MNNGSALGQNLSGMLNADQHKVVGPLQTRVRCPMVRRIQYAITPRESLRGGGEVGSVAFGIQDVLAEAWEAWEAIHYPGLEKRAEYESVLNGSQDLKRDEQRYMC